MFPRIPKVPLIVLGTVLKNSQLILRDSAEKNVPHNSDQNQDGYGGAEIDEKGKNGIGYPRLSAADAVIYNRVFMEGNCDFVSHAVHLLSLRAWSEKY